MARALKEEMQSEMGMNGQNPALQEQAPINPIQLQIGEDIQTSLVQVIIDDYDTAKRERDEMDYGTTAKGEKLSFDKWFEKLKHLYSGYREAKDVPWQFCSNRSLRIATSILEMLHSRLLSGVWNEDLMRWRATEVNDTPKAERITKLMTWWVSTWSPMKDFFDNYVKHVAGFGDGLTEHSWEVEETETSGTDELTGAPKISRKERTCSRIIPKESVFLFKNARDIQKDTVIIEEEIPYKDLELMEKSGQAVNITTALKEKIHVNVPTNITDDVEVEKFKQIKRRNVPVKVIRWYGNFDFDGSGFEKSVRVMASKDYEVYLGGVSMKDVTRSGKRPLEMGKYASYLDRVDSLMGEGVLEQVRELAEEVDAIFNQLSDSNTISILRPGFYDPSGDIDAPALKLAPNKLIPVSDPQNNVYFPEFKIQVESLINAIRLVLEFIERLTAASSYVMGRESEIVGGSGTATRTNAIMQSAEIRFARPVERLKTSAARIMNVLLDLIQLNIPQGMETRILGEKGEAVFQEGEITSDSIAGEFDAYLANDPAMGSKSTERELMSMLYSVLMQNMIVGTDPVKIYQVTAKLLKSYGQEPIEYLGPEPSMDDIDSPEDENTLMVQGDFGRVKANITENHLQHIFAHQQLMNSPSLALIGQTNPNLVNEIMQYNQQHIQEHTAMMQAMMGMIGKAGQQKGAGDGKGEGPTNPASDPNGGMENTQGPLAGALRQQQIGGVKPAS